MTRSPRRQKSPVRYAKKSRGQIKKSRSPEGHRYRRSPSIVQNISRKKPYNSSSKYEEYILKLISLGLLGVGAAGLYWKQNSAKNVFTEPNNRSFGNCTNKKYIDYNNLQVVKNEGGGDCLLHSIIDGLINCGIINKSYLNTSDLRKILVKTAIQYKYHNCSDLGCDYVGNIENSYLTEYKNVMNTEAENKNPSFDDIMKFISTDNRWLNDIDAFILAKYYDLHIVFYVFYYNYNDGTETISTQLVNTAGKYIIRIKYRNNHYEFLKEKT